jgi:tRNA (cytidine/uridine-2'-O-)-methyltransferase
MQMPPQSSCCAGPPATPERHVVLVGPEIHWNTGNVGRTCLGAGATLHLIEPLGFSLDSRQVKRAGLDYWPQVALKVWKTFGDLQGCLAPRPEEVLIFSKKAPRLFWQMPDLARLFLVFGSETGGLPEEMMAAYAPTAFRIPMRDHIRSLNLSTAVGIVLYESLKNGFCDGSAVPNT